MGFLGSALGTNSGFQAAPANIQNPVTGQQLTDAAGGTNAALAQQQAFANAVNGQNGLDNQSNVFNQMQGLSGQFQNIANGQGPNPAQAMLNQQTGNNVANQSAMMAGQRGASSNVGLMARQAAQQGANTQQQAVGQAATMQANQSLGALGQLQQQQANMAGLAGNQVAQQQGALQNLNQFSQNNQANLLNAQSSYNNALTSGQNAANALNQDTSKQNAGNNASMIGGLLSAGSSALSMMGSGGGGKAYGGAVGYADGGEVDAVPVQTTQAPAAPSATPDVPNEWSSLSKMAPSSGGGGGMMSMAMLAAAHGGMIPGQGCYADGGAIPQSQVPVTQGPTSKVGRFLKGASSAFGAQQQPAPGQPMSSQQQLSQGFGDFAKAMVGAFGGGQQQAPQAPPLQTTQTVGQPMGSTDLPQQQAPTMSPTGLPQGGQMYAAQGGMALNGEAYAQTGMKVPGQASVPGDSYANDTVPARLSPGEIIVDREHASDPMKAAQFAYAVAMRNKRGGK